MMKRDNVIFDLIEKEHQRQLKGMDGAFQPFEQVDAHETPDALFSSGLCQSFFSFVI